MVNATELNLDINKIKTKLGIKEKRQSTIPEMLFPKFNEPTISRWISCLLNPEQNKYGSEILNTLLRAIDVPECSSADYTVYSECFLGIDDERKKDNLIDIYISTSEHIIGIEVKLDATETDDQTIRYHKAIADQCKREHKTAVEIYLKPDHNPCKPKCSEYKIITFAEFLNGLKQLSENLPNDRDHFLIDEFIMYLEDGPERARFISMLSIEEKAILKSYHTQLYNNIKALFKENGFIAIDERHRETEGFGYMQLIRTGKEIWKKKLNFHYELLWNDSHYLALHSQIILAAHLEPPTKNKNRSEIIKFFNTEIPDRRTLHYKVINVDFTSNEGCRGSVKKIIETLECDEYNKWGDIADDCIKRFFGKEE